MNFWKKKNKMIGKKKKAVFFDRDGVVNYRIVGEYINSINEFKFIQDFLYLFPKVIVAGFDTMLITNQQGVSKGLMSIDQLKNVLNFMQNQLLNKFGAGFKDLYYCTDLAESGSYYRKPNPGMIVKAINQWNIDIEKSWMVGDSPTDAIAGKKAKLNTILIGNYSKEECPEADIIVKNLFDAEKIILSQETY